MLFRVRHTAIASWYTGRRSPLALE
jgi:hypothetical protein